MLKIMTVVAASALTLGVAFAPIRRTREMTARLLPVLSAVSPSARQLPRSRAVIMAGLAIMTPAISPCTAPAIPSGRNSKTLMAAFASVAFEFAIDLMKV